MIDKDTHSLDLADSERESLSTQEGISKAVAVRYDAEEGDAVPRVTASGRGAIAEQILKIAFEQGIKVRSDADLVEILEKIEVDSPIPLEAFAVVAEILVYVYEANATMKQRAARNMHKEPDV